MKNIIKRRISVLIGIVFVFSLFGMYSVYAEECVITASAVADGRTVVVTGQVSNAVKSHQITLLVGEPENILYIDQTTASVSGAFNFTFWMPEGLPAGNYTYNVGSNSGAAVYSGTIAYHGGVSAQSRKIVDADMDISLSSYVPSVSGTMTCARGKNVVMSITNTTDNTVIKQETITAESGVYDISFALPSMIYSKAYHMSIVCNDENGALMTVDADIISNTLSVTVNGSATTADGVLMNINARSTNTDLINKSGVVKGSMAKELTIPNIIPNAAFEVEMDGYETYFPAEEYSSCAVSGVSGDEITVVAKGWNISSFDREFELSYNAEQLEAVSLCGAYPDNSLEIGRYGNIEIVSYIPGKIVFKVHDINIPDGKVWSGAMNIFKFRFKEGHTGGSELIIK